MAFYTFLNILSARWRNKMKHFEFKGTLGEFLAKLDEYFGLKDLSKKVNAVIDIQDDEKEV